MREIRPIPLPQLSSSFATRSRGAEAYSRLLPLLKDGPVVLNFDGVDVMPVSFLDGLILKLIEGGYANHVSFMTDDARTKEKLQRVSGLRGVDVFVCGPNGRLETLEPKFSSTPHAQFSPEKPDRMIKES